MEYENKNFILSDMQHSGKGVMRLSSFLGVGWGARCGTEFRVLPMNDKETCPQNGCRVIWKIPFKKIHRKVLNLSRRRGWKAKRDSF
ncbi:unnamed protein product [Litomosoides sigmodontis]|uniref:Uncharacterized protein n=1 Tax=Litomosoides sigmodontis TaxID=42156 RepID=A0A3P6TAA2_LITSI|nr:unnamed protein product [Litomosoides sigmodontis]